METSTSDAQEHINPLPAQIHPKSGDISTGLQPGLENFSVEQLTHLLEKLNGVTPEIEAANRIFRELKAKIQQLSEENADLRQQNAELEEYAANIAKSFQKYPCKK